MESKHLLGVALVILLVLVLFLSIDYYSQASSKPGSKWVSDGFYVGIDAPFATVEETKAIIDEVNGYTNCFVIGSSAITYDVAALNEVCQYLYDHGLHFSPFTHKVDNFSQVQWASEARQKWGKQFLGLYAYDEAGGHQIDRTQLMPVRAANSTANAADMFVANVSWWLADLGSNTIEMFTSDYALYEFDYRSGYDTVFTQFGWNFSRPLHVALCRGAATTHNKDWGAIITWTYSDAPYLESGQELYDDMVYAYQNGAKYVLVFDHPGYGNYEGVYGTLQQEHLNALKRFWEYIKDNPRPSQANNDGSRVAYVLPKDYGFGFRGPNDTIWGIWESDDLSEKIWNDTNTLLEQYKTKLDIIYEDNLQLNISNYGKLIFWNGTTTDIT